MRRVAPRFNSTLGDTTLPRETGSPMFTRGFFCRDDALSRRCCLRRHRTAATSLTYFTYYPPLPPGYENNSEKHCQTYYAGCYDRDCEKLAGAFRLRSLSFCLLFFFNKEIHWCWRMRDDCEQHSNDSVQIVEIFCHSRINQYQGTNCFRRCNRWISSPWLPQPDRRIAWCIERDSLIRMFLRNIPHEPAGDGGTALPTRTTNDGYYECAKQQFDLARRDLAHYLFRYV